MREDQRHIGHVLHLRGDMGVALAVNRNWEFAEDVQNDGNVMRRKVPSDIDVLLEQAQIQAP